ncbi:phage holin family protein [Pontibacter burrus]|uniref:Uncharacterized protein n=1 Tax=Pontibacter burrus TaxID=2704466 RepID=A0A6B3LSK8_9BACT|nr:hypothetical protein [Pontibacter burrus]NEM97196.1 hypothetical protein [Pontibacter burrus]
MKFASDKQAHYQVEGSFRADGEANRAVFYPLAACDWKREEGGYWSTYEFDGWQMINFLLVLIMVDTVTGVYAAWKTSTSGVYSFKLHSIFEKL